MDPDSQQRRLALFGNNLETVVSSATQTVTIGRGGPVIVIGERINPTGRKKLMASLEQGDLDVVRRDALAQVEAGAAILDVNAGVPGADEPELMRQIIRAVRQVTDVPLCIDSPNPHVLEAGLREYEGKPLVNSVNGEERSLESILPLVKAYGAAVIGLAMDDDGIPQTAEKRLQVACKIIDRAERLGIPRNDVIIDPLVLAVCADAGAGRTTLEAIWRIATELGVNITMGASNVSHGLPDRPVINAAFLAMAVACGLTCPITNPLVSTVREAILASDLLLGHDEWAMRWMAHYRGKARS
ncbi:MAG: dihydropteroate synthase [Anaerolineae bacterium]|nr:dihydropteroate synthase [Anaerolineae bacterium]